MNQEYRKASENTEIIVKNLIALILRLYKVNIKHKTERI